MVLLATLVAVECGHLSHPPAFVSPSVGAFKLFTSAPGEERRMGVGVMRQARVSSLLRLNMVSVGDDVSPLFTATALEPSARPETGENRPWTLCALF